MLMRATSEGIHSSINIGYFEFNDIPYLAGSFGNNRTNGKQKHGFSTVYGLHEAKKHEI